MPHRQFFNIKPDEWERFLFEESRVPLAIVSADHRFAACNNAYCRLLGYARSELIGTRWQDYTFKADVAGDEDGAELLQVEGSEYSADKRYLCKDGSIQWVTVYVAAVRRDGKFFAYFVTAVPLKRGCDQERDGSGSHILTWIKKNPKDAAIIGGFIGYFLGYERLFQFIDKLINP